MGTKFKKKLIELKGTQYSAEDAIGQGQFGAIYRAKTKGKKASGEKLPNEVAIKEYFHGRFINIERDPEEYFKKEVSNLEIQGQFPAAQLKLLDSGIVAQNHPPCQRES